MGTLSGFLSNILDILNLLISPIPCKAQDSSNGTLELPAIDCKKFALSSLSNALKNILLYLIPHCNSHILPYFSNLLYLL